MITSDDITRQVTTATDASEGDYDVPAIVDAIIERYGRVDIDDIEHDEFWALVLDHAAMTARVSESVDSFYVQDPDGVEGELVQHEVTPAVIEDGEGDEVATFTGPISDDFDAAAWDAALADAGYRRVGPWDTAGLTAPVVTA